MKEKFKPFYPLNICLSSCSRIRGGDTDPAWPSAMREYKEGFVFGARMPIRPEPKGSVGRKLACGRRAALDQRDACVPAKNKPAFNFMIFKHFMVKNLVNPVKKSVLIRVNQCQKSWREHGTTGRQKGKVWGHIGQTWGRLGQTWGHFGQVWHPLFTIKNLFFALNQRNQ